MAILEDFIIKHVRPFSEQGYNTFCNKEMIDLLVRLQFDYPEIIGFFSLWQEAALADPVSNSNVFTKAASAVSVARWDELKLTAKSTVMFLNADQLQKLSHFQPTGPDFDWHAPTPISISVTIERQTGQIHIIWNAKGFRGATNTQGLISHFETLLR